MAKSLGHDLQVILRGLDCVAREVLKIQESQLKRKWNNSSFKALGDETSLVVSEGVKKVVTQREVVQVSVDFVVGMCEGISSVEG